jgi:UDP:flavonoid glycosyltransferase YjiC (YdhE family)
MFAGVILRAALPKMQKAVEEWQPDLIIRESIEYAGLIAAEAAGITHMRIEVLNGYSEEATIGDTVDAIDTARTAAGMKPDHGAALDCEPAFSAFPEAIDGTCVRRGQTVLRFAPLQDAASDTARTDIWPEPSDLPFAYMTFGTISARIKAAQSIYRIAIEAVENLPIRVLLTTGKEFPADLPEALPANVIVKDWVAQSDVLSRADLLIFHGGSGSMQGALAAGVPMVVTPMFADQPENAQRIVEAGIGLSVSTLDSSSLKSAIKQVLDDPKYRSNAQTLATELAAMPTAEDAVDALLKLVGARL